MKILLGYHAPFVVPGSSIVLLYQLLFSVGVCVAGVLACSCESLSVDLFAKYIANAQSSFS